MKASRICYDERSPDQGDGVLKKCIEVKGAVLLFSYNAVTVSGSVGFSFVL